MKNLAITNTPEEYRDVMVYKNEERILKQDIKMVKSEILEMQSKLSKMEGKLVSISKEENELISKINSRVRN